MKKIVYSALAIGAIFAAGLNLRMNTQNELSDIGLANVEALATEGSGNILDCYSEGDYKYGSYHYDCGPCAKVQDSKGVGNKRECVY